MASLLRFSEASSLALHTMVLLAHEDGEVLSTRQIAGALSASEAHLSKVLQRLAKTGLVRPMRGPKGGYSLGRQPDEINLLQVYETIEGPIGRTICLLGTPVCSGEKCILGGLLKVVNDAVREYLEETRLADLADVFGRKPCVSSGRS